MRRTLLRCVLSLALVGTAGVALASPAGAAKPARHACLGTTYSDAATDQPFPGALGHLVASFAQEPENRPGLGDGIQAVQAGLVPDEIVGNACN
jgi:hypothetical protein